MNAQVKIKCWDPLKQAVIDFSLLASEGLICFLVSLRINLVPAQVLLLKNLRRHLHRIYFFFTFFYTVYLILVGIRIPDKSSVQLAKKCSVINVR